MAADEVMLIAAVKHNTASLRIYQWQQPTLSLGYFQPWRASFSSRGFESLPLVRRLSGGGALLHDKELTYSFALPATHPLAKDNKSLYQHAHHALIEALQEFGIHAHLHCASNSQDESRIDRCREPAVEASSDLPFLCFQRFCPGDVLLQSGSGTCSKIIGSAQRRRRGAILQHGSILLATSEYATELPGICELTGVDLAMDEFVETISLCLAASLALDLSPRSRMASIEEQITGLQMSKYNQTDWNEQR